MAQLVATTVARRGDAAALIDERGTTSWSGLDRRVNRFVHAGRAAGLEVGDVVAVLSANRRELFEVALACMHAGWVVVPLNWHSVGEELAYVLEDAPATALVTDDRFAELACDAVARAGARRVQVAMAGAGGVPEGFVEYEMFLASAPATEPDDQCAAGPMFYTSGTTGRPKGVRSRAVPPGSALAEFEPTLAMTRDMLHIPVDGVTLLCGPAYHSAQWGWSVLPVLNGSTVVMRHGFDPAEVLALVDEQRVTNMHLVPTQFIRFLRLPPDVRSCFRGDSLRVVWHGAAPCPASVKRAMIEWWGPVLSEYYGGTESAIVTSIDAEEWLAHPGSVGRPWPSFEVFVLGDDGTPCAIGEPGALYFRSLQGRDFEYHNDAEKTAAAHQGPGVFTIGDVGSLDAEGYLWLSDRRIDMIISGGTNIYPAEIESVLLAHPAVRDAAVFGIPDDEFGEQVTAAVELEAGAGAADRAALVGELRDFCCAHLAGFKVPRTIDVVDALPRLPTGKLAKRLLRDPYWEGTGRTI